MAYGRYAERLFSFLLRLSRSRTVAEDLFQYTFLRLAEVGPRLPPGSNLRAWLFSVARNAFISDARARSVESRADVALIPAPSGAATGPDEMLALDELERAIFGLSPEDRELLLLVGVEGLSYLGGSGGIANRSCHGAEAGQPCALPASTNPRRAG